MTKCLNCTWTTEVRFKHIEVHCYMSVMLYTAFIASMMVVFYCYSTEILKIEHLWQFTSLTKLQLDNNIIEKIEGLENLTNLVWLGEFRLFLL